jgi:hypothetical protein
MSNQSQETEAKSHDLDSLIECAHQNADKFIDVYGLEDTIIGQTVFIEP